MKFGQLALATFIGGITLVSATSPRNKNTPTERSKLPHSQIFVGEEGGNLHSHTQLHRPLSPRIRSSPTRGISRIKLAPGRDGIGRANSQGVDLERLYGRDPWNMKGTISAAKSSGLASKATAGYRRMKAGAKKKNVKAAGKALVKGAGGGSALASALGNTWALYRQTQGYSSQYRRGLEEQTLSMRGAVEDNLYLRDLREFYLASRHDDMSRVRVRRYNPHISRMNDGLQKGCASDASDVDYKRA